ncbi:MAG TPA: SDR family oxidoreductase [Nitrososphaeraceae archaeon]|nr:SDR family oxidoreductase [Nitrososphaeraceae archaeon]
MDNYAQSNIRINAVAAGNINTPMIQRLSGSFPEGRQVMISQEQVGRMGQPEDIASTVLWLCSDADSFVTGYIPWSLMEATQCDDGVTMIFFLLTLFSFIG